MMTFNKLHLVSLLTVFVSGFTYSSQVSTVDELELLNAAVKARQWQIVSDLANKGADLNAPLIGEGTLLMQAVQRNDRDAVAKLIEMGADPNQSSPGDGSPLILAIKNQYVSLVDQLLEMGADPDLFVKGDETPLIQATRQGSVLLVKRLIDAGATVSKRVDDDGIKVDAISESRHSNLTRLLNAALADENERKKQFIGRVEKDISLVLKRYHLPSLSIAVNIEGNIVWQHAVGYADLAQNKLATTTTPYAIGSISKSLTSVATAKLLAQDTVSLDAPIHDYHPYPAHIGQLTLRQIASHTAGLSHYTKKREEREFVTPRDHKHPSESLDIFIDEPLKFEPGHDFQYSSNGYILLSDVLAKASNTNYVKLMEQLVFEPLNMTRTELDTSRAAAGIEATYYEQAESNGQHTPATTHRDRSFLFGGGAYLSTPSDLVNFAWGIQQPAYLHPKYFSDITTPVALKSGEMNNQHYALGWRVHQLPLKMIQDDADEKSSIKGIHHGGTVSDAASAYLLIYPDLRMSIAFTTNTIPSNQSEEHDIRMDMWKLLYQFHLYYPH